MAGAMIGNLAVSLTMQTAAFQRGATVAEKRAESMKGRMSSATASVRNLGAVLGVAVGADALFGVVAGAFEMASSLSEAAEKAGLTVEALQELRFAAEQTGVSNESLEGSLVRMQRAIGNLGMGVPSSVKAFDQLGISMSQLQGLSPDESFRLIAEALSQVQDKGTQAALGQQIFGRAFAQLLPIINGGKEGLDAYAEASRKNGQISTEDAAKLDVLADRWGELKNQVMVATANILAGALPMAEQVGAALDATRLAVHNFREGVIALPGATLGAITNLVNGIKTWIGDKLGAIWDGAVAKIKAVERSFAWLYDKVIGHSWIPDLVSGADAEFSRLSAVMVQPAEAAAVRVERTFKDMADATLGAFSRLTGAIKSGGFLGILEAVIGVGLQLGSIGAFGKGIATRINSPSGTSGYISPPKAGGSGGGTTIQINPSPYFNVVVDGRVGAAAPAIAQAGASGGVAKMQYQQSRRW